MDIAIVLIIAQRVADCRCFILYCVVVVQRQQRNEQINKQKKETNDKKCPDAASLR